MIRAGTGIRWISGVLLGRIRARIGIRWISGVLLGRFRARIGIRRISGVIIREDPGQDWHQEDLWRILRRIRARIGIEEKLYYRI